MIAARLFLAVLVLVGGATAAEAQTDSSTASFEALRLGPRGARTPDAGGASDDDSAQEKKPDTANVRRSARSSPRPPPPLAGEPPWDDTLWEGPPLSGWGRDRQAQRRLRERRSQRRAREERAKASSAGGKKPGSAARGDAAQPRIRAEGRPMSSAPRTPLDRLSAEFDDAFWVVLRTLFVAFVILRAIAWWVRREVRRGKSWAEGPLRVWVFVEILVWALIAVWVSVNVFPERSVPAVLLGMSVVAIVLATGWTALRDLVAGLILGAERPFDVGDSVRVADVEGQVVAFRARVLELKTSANEQVRVPYRRIVGTTRVKGGGAQAAHAVHLSFDLPEGLTPQEALRTVRELAASSSWAVLGAKPQVDVAHEGATQRIVLEAYAFSGEARAELSCDLDAGWKAFLRRSETRSPSA